MCAFMQRAFVKCPSVRTRYYSRGWGGETENPCAHQTYISWRRVLKRNRCQVVMSTKKKNEQGEWRESGGRGLISNLASGATVNFTCVPSIVCPAVPMDTCRTDSGEQMGYKQSGAR